MSTLREQERDQMLNDKCCAQIHSYIDSSLKENNAAISFADFVRVNQEFIKENTREGTDYKEFWPGLFGRVIQERGLQVQKGTRADWSFFDANAGLSSTGNHQVSASVLMKNIKTRSTRQSSKSDSLLLTLEAKKQFERDFIAMEDDKKWFLRHDNEGNKVFLEDIMFKHGINSPYEHPVHSFIMDVTDPFWESKLEDEDYEAIASVNDPTLPALSASILNIFDVCAESVEDLENSSPTTATEVSETNKAIIKKLWKAVTSFGFFDPDQHPDEDWLQRTILDYLSMYRHSTLDEMIRNGSEMDFVLHCWRNLDRCFEDFATVGRWVFCLLNFVVCY
ncbi:hypothetical protein BJV82DRAFT_577650 [Fennellomyces sp. T-0311]|nr:hypothetical protein BJV82DRAFT_577650 [Fennellomyces sp. T-0311]